MLRRATTLACSCSVLLLASCHDDGATAPGPDASHVQILDSGALPGPDAGPTALDAATVEPADAGAQDAAIPDAASPPDASAPPPYSLQVLAQYTDAMHDLLYVNGTVYAVNSAANEVLAFSAATYAQTNLISVGKVPGNLSTDGHYLFVVNLLASALGQDAYVSVVDTTTNSVAKSLLASEKHQGSDPNNYPTTTFPWAATALNGTLFVDFPANPSIPGVSQFNIIPVTIGSWSEGTMWYSGSGTDQLAGSNGKLFVIDGRAITNPDDDAVAVFQSDGTAVQTLETGGKLVDIVAASSRVWVTRTPTGKTYGEVLVIDEATLEYHPVEVCLNPYDLAVSGNRLYVSCQDGLEVDAIDMASEQVVERIPLGGFAPAISKPRGIAVSPGGDVFLESDGMISVLVKQ